MEKFINQPDYKNSKTSHLKFAFLILAVVIIALIAGGGLYLGINQKKLKYDDKIIKLQNYTTQIDPRTENIQATNQDSVIDINMEDYEYILLTQYSKNFDQKLIRRNPQTGEETVVIASVKEAIPELRAYPNLLLAYLAHPKGSQVVIFKSILFDTDNPIGFLYSFNTKDNMFSKMKINEIYDGFFGGFVVSPKQTKLVWVPDAQDGSGWSQIMYIADLAKDQYKIAVRLMGSETFNGGGYAMSSYFDLSWISEEQIRYSIFDQAKKVEGFNSYSATARQSIFIGYRQLDL